jgi:hypothetical protein
MEVTKYVVVELPFTGGEPQTDFDTKAEADAFIQSVRDGKNPFSGKPLAEDPYEYRAESLGVTTFTMDAAKAAADAEEMYYADMAYAVRRAKSPASLSAMSINSPQ